LNIPTSVNCQQVCAKAFQLGYKILAINTIVVARECVATATGKIGKKRKFEKRDTGTVAANAITASDNAETGVPRPGEYGWIDELLEENPGCRILRRLTIIFGDVSDLHKVITHANCALYDVIGVVPVHADAVQACLTARHLAFDVISFDLEGPYWMKKVNISRQKGSMAADREIYFEITYSAGLHDESACENMIYTAHRLLEDACTKRIKNIIISSGAAKPEELRAPKDMNAFGFILGLNETASIQSVREHPLRIVQNADSRKHGKTWVTFKPFNQSDPDVAI